MTPCIACIEYHVPVNKYSKKSLNVGMAVKKPISNKEWQYGHPYIVATKWAYILLQQLYKANRQ